MKKNRFAVLAIIAFLCVAGCANDTIKSPAVQTLEPFTSLHQGAAYLGQPLPGMEPEVFAPGIVSSEEFHEYSGTFSPDGTEYYFYRFSDDMDPTLFFAQLVDGEWTSPEPLELTAEYSTGEPHVTLDNQWLYFMWGKPVEGGNPNLPPYFASRRTADGWSEPVYAGQGMFMSSSIDGQIYTTDMSEYLNTRKTYLARVAVEDGVFIDFERLEIRPRYGTQAHPCIAPDGSYILFDVSSGSHLYVSFKQADGTWGEAIDLVEHGFDRKAGGATIPPDGKYLFCALAGDIWWVDIAVIETLRPTE
jgi:hypothetical protein